MIQPSPSRRELEARYQRAAFAHVTYVEALDRCAALWAEARVLNPGLGADWRADLEADLAVARAVNGSGKRVCRSREAVRQGALRGLSGSPPPSPRRFARIAGRWGYCWRQGSAPPGLREGRSP